MWFYHLTWHRHTRSASVANISTTFPFPSSPHWAPNTTVTLAISDLPRLWGKITPFTLFDILPAYEKTPTHSCTHLQIENSPTEIKWFYCCYLCLVKGIPTAILWRHDLLPRRNALFTVWILFTMQFNKYFLAFFQAFRAWDLY